MRLRRSYRHSDTPFKGRQVNVRRTGPQLIDQVNLIVVGDD